MDFPNESLKGKRVIITGGAGFLGRKVVDKLVESGVTCKDLFVPRSKTYDLRREADIDRMLHEFPPDIVVHLAAKVGGIGFNMENPGTLFYDNLLMGVQLIERTRLKGIEKFVAVGTVCAYPKHCPTPFRETDIWEGYPEETNAPYGLAKKMLLVQLQAYRKQHGFNGIYLLPVNLYGPGDNFSPESSHVIPAIIKKFDDAIVRGDEQVTIWGDGSASREFLYVDDAARGIAMATISYDGAEPVNLGNGREVSIRDLTRMISSLMGFDGEIVWDISKPNGQPRRCLDTSRAEELFGFRAQMRLEEGLKRTIDWYRGNSKKLK
jgi:GDP-L-fucose synthase